MLQPNYSGGGGGAALGGFSCYPDCSEGDQSVPIFHAYNHHYFSWLTGAHADLQELEEPTFLPNPTKTRFVTREGTNHSFPTSLVFKENPGGEFRKSYHGYPSGFAQLLHSPTQWTVEPMQIDTHNRNFNITQLEAEQDQLWFLPATFKNNMTDYESGLNPLIECPCTDRITKSTKQSTNVIVKGNCRLEPQSQFTMAWPLMTSLQPRDLVSEGVPGSRGVLRSNHRATDERDG